MYSSIHSADSKFSSAEPVKIPLSADSSSTAATASKLSSAENSENNGDKSTVKDDSDSSATPATSSKFSSAENSENNADYSTVKAESVNIPESAKASSPAATGDRLVCLCYRDESDPIAKRLSAAFNARREDMPVQTRLIICKEFMEVSFLMAMF